MDFTAIDPKKLSPADIAEIAGQIAVEPAALGAVCDVESNGKGFWGSGNLVMRFEAHIFVSRAGQQAPVGGPNDYETLRAAMDIDETAALESTSWGMFQIMGFNHRLCGVDNVVAFVQEHRVSERRQLELCAKFLEKSGCLPYLQQRHWAGFARMYNGPGYRQNAYDQKLADAYRRRGGAGDAGVTGHPVLRMGDADVSSDGPVHELQRRLNKAGGLPFPLNVDGRFGPGTREHVIDFQNTRGLLADGVVGEHTWTALEPYK